MSAPTVMLVEDNIAIRTLQRFVLVRAGMTVVECPDLAEGEKMLETVVPDVVVLDLNLPGGHGLSLLPRIDRTRTGVLVMSAMNQQHTESLSTLQADAFMPKPFEPAAFVTRVQSLIRQFSTP